MNWKLIQEYLGLALGFNATIFMIFSLYNYEYEKASFALLMIIYIKISKIEKNTKF